MFIKKLDDGGETATVVMSKVDAEVIIAAVEALHAKHRTLVIFEREVLDVARTLDIVLKHPALEGN